jgi:hypothetical protein
VACLLVYVFVIAGSSSAPELHASRQGLHGVAAGNGIRHVVSGVTHISLGKGCGGTKANSNRHVVVTRSGGAFCATGGTMYAELLAMHTPRAEILQLLIGTWVTRPGMSQYQAEYQHLRSLGAPKKLAHQLAVQVAASHRSRQP